MVDLAIGAAISGLKTAAEIAGGFVKLRDEAMIQAKVIELQSVILTAQGNALTAQGEQFSLLDAKRELEAKIAELEAWEREKKRYELKDVGNGCFAYVLKLDAAGTEPPHSICANCYQQGRKSILHRFHISIGHAVALQCHACGSEMIVEGHDLRERAKLAAKKPPAPRGSLRF